jgi:nucleoid-associated protein YgaU
MTSDAKIGLLLGLVFIFIIAFVINGLPRFRSAVGNNKQASNIVDPRNDAQAIGQRERRAQNIFEWQQQYEAEPAEGYETPAQNPVNTADTGLGPVEEFEPVSEFALIYENPESIRYQMPLTPNASVIENTTIEEPSYLPQSVVPQRNTEPLPVRSTEAAGVSRPKPYIVQEGDGNLSNIAKKFYGPVEGNRLVNVNRIFEANRGILQSADEIFVGQKLIIPPLPISTQSAGENRSVLSDRIFERVDSIGGGSNESIRWYVVKEDDSLWKIAEKQLGNGSRYKEISKLNADILVNEDEVDPGMRLKLPAR